MTEYDPYKKESDKGRTALVTNETVVVHNQKENGRLCTGWVAPLGWVRSEQALASGLPIGSEGM